MLGSNAVTSRIYGGAAGADYRFSPSTVAGLALAGGGTGFTVANGGSGRSDLFQAGAFIKHKVGPAYLSGALAYGWQDITTDRTVTIAAVDRLRAQFNANAFSGRVEGGYRFVGPWIGGVGVTPTLLGSLRHSTCRLTLSKRVPAPTPLRSPMVRAASLRPAANSVFEPTNPLQCRRRS